MKYLPAELKREYEYYIRQYPDRPELQHPFVNLSDAFRAYFILADYFMDDSCDEEQENMLIGIRSIDLLDSALCRQVVSFGGKQKYTNPLDICSTLFFGVTKNHSFSDGNKRTALLLLLYQLQMFGYVPCAPKKEFEKIVLSVADSSIDKRYKYVYKKYEDKDDPIIHTLTHIIRKMVKKKNGSYHTSPTMREFCSALNTYGVEYRIDNGKMHFSYKDHGFWKRLTQKTRSYSIPFGGWTRTVGAKTARDVLRGLKLYDQFPGYQDLLNGSEPLYALVDDFKEPLRRLKDE